MSGWTFWWEKLSFDICVDCGHMRPHHLNWGGRCHKSVMLFFRCSCQVFEETRP